jgi:sporulation protein YlmC with PRC-barrel domain
VDTNRPGDINDPGKLTGSYERGGVHGAGNPRVLSASSIIGDSVRNSQNEDLGNIEELMVDLNSGRIAYAVLSFGGFLGLGDKLFAIPWHALKVQPDEHAFLLEADKETLKTAPGFDKNNWPDMADPKWGSEIYNFYGQRGYWENP